MRALIFAIVVCSLLGACSTSPYGRTQFTVPQSVSDVYSDVNMRLQMAVAADAKNNCVESECDASKDFEFRVAQLGQRLADKAFEIYPDLHERIAKFEFVIAEKAEPGTTSNASGTVVIFRGTSALDLSEPALAFMLAREMGHVIGRHHNENSATRIVASVLASVLLPVSGLVHALSLGASGAAAASATTTTATAATSTAASFFGSRAVIANYWPTQLREADEIALSLLARLGYDPQETADALAAAGPLLDDSSWPQDLRTSAGHVAQIAQGPRPDRERLAQIAASAPMKLTYVLDGPPAKIVAPSPRRLTH